MLRSVCHLSSAVQGLLRRVAHLTAESSRALLPRPSPECLIVSRFLDRVSAYSPSTYLGIEDYVSIFECDL